MPSRFTALALVAALATPAPVLAQVSPAQVDTLVETMGLHEMIVIMQAEGLEYGETIAQDLFPDRPAEGWSVAVEDIYALETMDVTMRASLAAALNTSTIDDITAFFASDLGQEIVSLEVAARRALMDEAVEEASNETAALALADETPRAQQATSFVEANDLIETNVVGAMNANYAFYLGLLDGGGLPGALSEDEILATVWAQEAEIRQNTSEWIYSYIMLAYQPLSDEEFDAYIAFSGTEAGRDINTALFAAFDVMYENISRALGRAASQQMVGEDL